MDLSSPLLQVFFSHPSGICGHFEPAHDITHVDGIDKRLGILAFGVVADPNPLSRERWEELVQIQDLWIFDATQTARMSSQQVLTALQQARVRVPKHIARVWWQISRGVQGRVKGSWRELLRINQDDVQTMQTYLEQSSTTFPVLAGPVLSSRWLDLVQRIGGVKLSGWESLRVPLPDELEGEAHLFGETKAVHPSFASALRVWKQECQKGRDVPCGLTDCPLP